MADPVAEANLIADTLVTLLLTISRADDRLKWMTDPREVKRGLLIGDLQNLERPRLAVQVLSVRAQPYSSVHSDGTLRLGVHMIQDGTSGAEDALNAMARDVIKVVALNPTLRGTVTDCQFQEYVPQVEAMERTGLGIATVVFEAIYLWAHDAP